jgi:uroporphyrinogen III methyltransferase/synthase
MGMRRLGAIAQAVIAGGRSEDTPTAVVQWGARPQQRVLTATLGTVAAEVERIGLSNPAVVIIGDVVSLRAKLSWYERMPLFGVRILVPRAPHQATATARAIRLRGAEPVLYPVIQIEDPPDDKPLTLAVQQLTQYDWVLFTSPNGVQRFFAELHRQHLDSRALGGVKLGAIGPKTEAELTPHGIRADLVARSFVGEALAQDVVKQGVGQRILIPRALVAREQLPEQLRAAGAQVDVVPAYRTSGLDETRAQGLAELVRSGGVDVAMFTSGSTVTHTCAALGPGAAKLLERVRVASIGPITSAALTQHGVRIDVEADTFTVDGLLDTLERSVPLVAS